MVDSDSKPLIDPSSCDEDEDEKEKENYDFKKMVFFHGKELAGKSFVRSPQQNLVRIGIGKNGVYKLEGKSPKVLAHWKFREIRDSSYSGYSFSLQLQGGKEYYIRTDDGESICMYIDLFRKDPDRALEQALNDPPMSNIPESGIWTLRRKFTSEQRSSGNKDVKFYTLNRRTAKNAGTSDPISKHPHNIEVDKRLRPNSIGSREEFSKQKVEPFDGSRPRGRSVDVRPLSAQDNKSSSFESSGEGVEHVNGVKGGEQKREVTIDKMSEKEKRHSNGIIISPVSTRGEVTTTESTKTTASPSSGSPINPRKTGQSSFKPVQQETKLASSSTTTTKQSSPPTKSRDILPSDSSSTSNDTAPLIRPASSSSSGPFSPTDEFQFVSGTDAEKKMGEPLSSTSGRTSAESGEVYDRLENYDPDANQDDVISLPESTSTIESSAPLIRISRDEREKSEGTESLRMSTSPESNCSGEYDHLPPLIHTSPDKKKQTSPSKLKVATKLDLLPSPLDLVGPRRNFSQPALSTPASARESPCELIPANDIIIEESSEDEETAETPTNVKEGVSGVQFEGVVLRKKHLDPFADILESSSSRLRWSQELNPLYDYIKGYKISEGVKLYDSPSKLLESTRASDILGQGETTNHKPPSVIIEEDFESSSLSSREQTCSPPNENVQNKGSERLTEATCTLPRARRPVHNYEEVMDFNTPLARKLDSSQSATDLIGQMKRAAELKKIEPKTATLGPAYETPVQRRFRSLEKAGVSPRLGKRQLQQQRRSKTLNSVDDTATVTRKQRPMRAADALKDFSFVMREYRTFFVKLPTGVLHQEIFCVNKPVSELREKLCDVMGIDSPEHYQLYVEGACLTTLKECEAGAELSSANRVNRSGSLTQLVDSQALPDQGTEPILLKANLSLRMQGVTTTRILALLADDEATDSVLPTFELLNDDEEFHRRWMSIVQGNTPCTLEEAIPLAALQYQAYFLGRTAVHSVVGFCRPTEFLPVEYAGIRGVEHKMYKIQEKLRNKTNKEIEDEYILKYSRLQSADTVFFPAREPRKKVFQSTKLKPILLGINKHGILRVDAKTKEVLDFWEYQVLKNWAYSKRTFVLAFANKTYPVESNQAKWISELIDFHVDSIAATTEGTDL